MTEDREKWHEGWRRNKGVVYVGHPHCAGCGKCLGLAALAIDPNWTPPPDPSWPFNEEDCPVCGGTARDEQDRRRGRMLDILMDALIEIRGKGTTSSGSIATEAAKVADAAINRVTGQPS